MKIFLSWSGYASNQLAQALRTWLPGVLQATKPYYSPDDIAKGARWNAEVATELQESRVGILCVTPENMAAPWLMFEAGALAKSLERSRVIPLLLGIDAASLSGPLAQFQATKFDRTDVKRMISVINAELGANGLEDSVLSAVYEKWWPELESRVNAICVTAEPQPSTSKRPDREILEEILSLIRDQTFGHRRERVTWNPLGKILDLPIEALDLTPRTENCLRAENIYNVGEILERTEYSLLRTPNLGRKSLNELKEALSRLKLELRPGDGADSAAG